MTYSNVLRDGRIITTAVTKFETPTSSLVVETVDSLFVRHYRLRDERETFCDLVIHKGEPGYSSTCVTCNRLMRRIRQARSAEGQRRAQARRESEPPLSRIEQLRKNVMDELRQMPDDVVKEFFDTLGRDWEDGQ